MKIDKLEHQQFLLELLVSASYPGKILDLVYEVMQAVKHAEVVEQETTQE